MERDFVHLTNIADENQHPNNMHCINCQKEKTSN